MNTNLVIATWVDQLEQHEGALTDRERHLCTTLLGGLAAAGNVTAPEDTAGCKPWCVQHDDGCTGTMQYITGVNLGTGINVWLTAEDEPTRPAAYMELSYRSERASQVFLDVAGLRDLAAAASGLADELEDE